MLGLEGCSLEEELKEGVLKAIGRNGAQNCPSYIQYCSEVLSSFYVR